MQQNQYTIGDIQKMIARQKSPKAASFVVNSKSEAEKSRALAEITSSLNKLVTKVDLSTLVSKHINETCKNLDKVFAKAEKSGTVLLFDEADALFGKRTGVRDSHDKYANAEASYLLQRAEQFNGVIIYAARSRANLDDAFIRRVQGTVHFPPAGA